MVTVYFVSYFIVVGRARYGTNGFRTEPAAPPEVLESVPVLARTRGFRRCLGRTGPTGTGRYGYGFYGSSLGGARVLRVRNPGADTRSAPARRFFPDGGYARARR